MMDGENADKTYSWENEYERTWEALAEDDEGLIQSSVDDIVSRARRKRLLARPLNVRLGIMRHVFVVIDMSSAMLEQDLKPNRHLAVTKLLELFITEFVDQNPVSQLGLILTRQKRAEKLTELGGNPQPHLLATRRLRDMVCEGEPSMHNSFELAAQTLRFMPGHASREVLIIMGSLTTCDSQDIDCTIDLLKQQNVRCSVIGLSAEVNVCKRVAHETGGKYHIILDESHLKDLLMQYLAPPPATVNAESSLIKMGFPSHQFMTTSELDEKPSLCMCHLEQKINPGLDRVGYICPQCKSKYCDLPVECRVCGLVLVSAPHLARSYHHLFPITVFSEEQTEHIKKKVCLGCEKKLGEKAYVCGQCSNAFCVECDVYIHDMLHYCPACS